MRTSFAVALLLLPVTAAACAKSGQNAEQAADTTAAAQPAAPAMAPTTPAPTTVNLAAKNNSGITGTAALKTMGDSVQVTVNLVGLKAGQTYPAHVHQGTCDAGGPVAAPLTSVAATADGTGSSTTTIAASAMAAGNTYFVQAHQPGGQPAACGDIPAGGQGSM